MPKKIYKFRGGYAPKIPSMGGRRMTSTMRSISRAINTPGSLAIPKISNLVKNPYVRTGVNMFTNYAAQQIFDYVRRSGDGVIAKVSNGEISKSTYTPNVVGVSGSITRTMYVEGKERRVPSVFKNAFTFNRINNYSGSFACTAVGTQAVQQTAMLNATAMGNIFSDHKRNTNATSVYPQPNSMRVYFDKMSSETRYSNSGNTTLVLDIYECVPRMDISDDTIDDPVSAWQSGLVYQLPYNAMSGLAQTPQTYGAKPFASVAFTHFWSVKKVFRVELPPGSSHVHTSVYHINKVANQSIPQLLDTVLGSMRGFTKSQLLVLSGTPVHSAVNSENVSVGIAGIDWTTTLTVLSHSINQSTTITEYVSSFPSFSDGEQFVVNNPDDQVSAID